MTIYKFIYSGEDLQLAICWRKKNPDWLPILYGALNRYHTRVRPDGTKQKAFAAERDKRADHSWKLAFSPSSFSCAVVCVVVFLFSLSLSLLLFSPVRQYSILTETFPSCTNNDSAGCGNGSRSHKKPGTRRKRQQKKKKEKKKRERNRRHQQRQ